jgi:hypothetical protein
VTVFRQTWLPGFPEGAQKVGEALAILERDEQVRSGGGAKRPARRICDNLSSVGIVHVHKDAPPIYESLRYEITI